MEQWKETYNTGWSDWKSFPDPRKGEYINAPLGSGVYQLRNKKTNRYVLFGEFVNCGSISLTGSNKSFVANTRQTKKGY